RAVLQRIEIHARLCPVQLPELPRREGLGGNGDYNRAVPGIRTHPARAESPLERGGTPLVGGSTIARPVPRLPPTVRRRRTEIPLGPPKNFRRHRQTQTPAHKRITPRIPSRIMKNS